MSAEAAEFDRAAVKNEIELMKKGLDANFPPGDWKSQLRRLGTLQEPVPEQDLVDERPQVADSSGAYSLL